MPCIHMPQFEFLLTWSMMSWLSQAQFCPKTFIQGAISKQGPFAQIKLVPRHEWKSGETFMVQDKGIACLVRVCQCFYCAKKARIQGTALLHSSPLSDLSACQCIRMNYTNKLVTMSKHLGVLTLLERTELVQTTTSDWTWLGPVQPIFLSFSFTPCSLCHYLLISQSFDHDWDLGWL